MHRFTPEDQANQIARQGQVIPLIPLENMSDTGLIAHYRLTEANVEQGIEYIKFVGSVMQDRSVSKYDDFHDVFPDDPA